MPRAVLVLALILAGVVAGAPAAGGNESRPDLRLRASQGELRADIRRTANGIPHILAGDYAGVAYGYAYAFAQDNICVMADTYLTSKAQRSRYLGPDKTYDSRGNGARFNNLDSDFFYQRARDTKIVEKLLDQPAPHGPIPDVKEAVRGYVAGYNQYLRDTGVDNIPDPACRGKEWVQPITELDAYMRFYQLGILASQGVVIDGIAQAQPPTPPVMGSGRAARKPSASREPSPARTRKLVRELGRRWSRRGLGSNAYGLGRDATDNGRGMVLANPHFPWDGPERFYQAQLTIPGRNVNVTGASLFGVPAVLIGHTDNLAWSHTVSTAFRFTPFELKLVPGSPTTYLYDGQPRQMTVDTVTVQARQPDGTLKPQSRKLYSALQGPILNSILGLPLFPWTPERAYAIGDVNATNFRYLNHFFETDRAQSVGELDAIERRNQGIPWVNTIAADSKGDAYYADIGAIPNVSDAKSQQCVTGALGAGTRQLLGLPILDGSTSACAWGTDPDSVAPGTFGPSKEPSLFRDDYVTNSNNSYWLSNPAKPLEGFARIIGTERTARSLRTRIGLMMVEERLAGTDGAPGNRFSTRQVQDAVFSNRQPAGELWQRELVAMCKANPVLPGSSGPVDVSAACPVLERWDRRENLESRGALLFRRFAGRALAANASPYREAFDVKDPVHTPRGLNTDNADVRRALADAVQELRDSKIPLDAPLEDFQYELRGEERIPIHGGPGDPHGNFNAINVPFVAGKGYPNVPHGSSFVMVTHFTDGCPENPSILTYSLSTDPTSPYFADQTRMFSQKRWLDAPYCERDILADPSLKTTRLSPAGARPGGGAGCLRRGRLVSRGIGAVRLRDTRSQMQRRAGAPATRTARVLRYCASGGGSVNAVFSTSSSRARATLVTSSAPGARAGRARVGRRFSRRGARRVAPGLYAVGRRGTMLVGVRRGRVAFVGVTSKRQARRTRALRRYARVAAAAR